MVKIKQSFKTIITPHFWVIVVLFIALIVLQYPQQILGTNSPSLLGFLGLNRATAERILLLIPVTYTIFLFGKKAGFLSLGVAAIIMLPRVFLISQYTPDSLVETFGIVFTGGLINLLHETYRREKKSHEEMMAKLELANRQLESHTRTLEETEKRYRQLFENAHDAIWVHDFDGNLLTVNRAAETLTGYSAAELKTMNVKIFLSEESMALAKQIRRKLEAGETVVQPYEQRLTRRDGSQRTLKLSTSQIKEGSDITGFLHISRDVTIEKEMQEKLMAAYDELNEAHQRLKENQEQLIQIEKLTSLGQLAASVAHEVNNPLSGVLIYTQLLTKKIGGTGIPKEVALEYLSKMESELTRSTRLIRNLLDFARQSPPAFRELNLNDVVNRAYDLAAHTAQMQHVEAIKELDPSLPTLTADFDQLQQVFTNLILNAVQAMAQGGKLTIRTGMVNGDVLLQVSDTGCGITPENMRKLFTPFFTTKREVKGVGLGLAVSYGIIQRHKGKIEVRSKVGEGTTFVVRLPVNPVGTGAASSAPSAAAYNQ